MKPLSKILIPILAGLVIAVLIIILFTTLISGAFTPKDAVSGYLKASMLQDISGMLKYSSPYQKIVLYGNKDYTDSKLKNMLHLAYKDRVSIYSDSVITFAFDDIAELDKESKEYKAVLEEYEYLTGNTDIDDVCRVTVKVFVDGNQKQKSTVYSLKIGFTWYYSALQVNLD